MQKIELVTTIKAPLAVCFDLSRSIDLHKKSMANSKEEVIAGICKGLINLNEEVTWRGKHFGVWFTHSAKITKMEAPSHFQDTMIKGRFKYFVHDHYFEEKNGLVQMRDVIEFQSPFGLIGIMFDFIFLKRYLTNLIKNRNNLIKTEAEKK
jgi:ligand-binding SRPBCC domain-containing protein